jgi:hypothetical protein
LRSCPNAGTAAMSVTVTISAILVIFMLEPPSRKVCFHQVINEQFLALR